METRLDLAHLLPPGGTFIELGVASGRYATQLLAANPRINYIGIDRWSDHHDEQEHRSVLTKLAPHSNAKIIRSTFTDAAPQFAPESVDIIYVDGYAHTGQEAGATLDEWWSKVRPGGILAGHDYCMKYLPTIEAVDKFARKQNLPVKIIVEPPYNSWLIRKPEDMGEMIPKGSNVILVGNGPSLLASKKGSTIDQFDEVVRFNRFRMRGYEDHIGSKTTVWSTIGRGQTPEGLSSLPPKTLLLHGNQRPAFLTERLFRPPAGFYGAIRRQTQSLSKLSPEAVRHILPSSGLLVAIHLLEHLSVPHITIAGFDHFDRSGSGMHHYWVPGEAAESKEHDGQAEKALLAPYFDAGRISRL
jgi:predicted O-methyltransferase YrrM